MPGRGNEAAALGFLGHNAGVVIGVYRRGYGIGQFKQRGQAADRFQLAGAGQFVGQGQHVKRGLPGVHSAHGRECPPMGRAVEIGRGDNLGHVEHGVRVNE